MTSSLTTVSLTDPRRAPLIDNETAGTMATLISVASGKGGVGKSVVSANLALALAKRGRQVILADLDVGGADAHIMFGELNPSVTLTDFLNKRVNRLIEAAIPITMHPNLRLIAGTGDTLATANMAYARKKRLMKQFRELESDIVVLDIGAGTNFHALDFFLMADIHVAVATPEPTSVLDLYRFIKLAAIRRVLACFLARSPMSEVLSNRDFTSVEEVMEVAGATDAGGRDVAAAALQSFRPGLIVNRVSDRSQVNVLYLRKILHQYVGGDLTLLGEIPDDPAVSQAVRKFLPVLEAAPESPSAKGLLAVSAAVEQVISASAVRRKEQTTQREEKQTRVLLSTPTCSQVSQASSPLQSNLPLPSIEPKQPVCANTVQDPGGASA
ncbi:MAG: MinD/ParA family protein [Nitrospira sp.]|nr:MAG: MinD/ParA family protein [Nitrospira sp.]